MHAYMKQFNKTTVMNGVDAVLSGEMDAFIYDGTVLDYLTSQDEDCRLLTVSLVYFMKSLVEIQFGLGGFLVCYDRLRIGFS